VLARGMNDIRTMCHERFENSHRLEVKLLYSASSSTRIPPFPELNIRYKLLLCVLKMKEKGTFVKFLNADQFRQQPGDLITVSAIELNGSSAPTRRSFRMEFSNKRKVVVLKDLFPVTFWNAGDSHPFLDIDLERGPIPAYYTGSEKARANYEIIEIFEVYIDYEKIFESVNNRKDASMSQTNMFPQEREEDEEDSVSKEKASREHQNGVSIKSFQALHSYMTAAHSGLEEEKTSILKDLAVLPEEIHFCARYFAAAWFNEKPDPERSPNEILAEVTQKRKIKMKYEQNVNRNETDNEDDLPDPSTLSPIISFNVEGDIFPILRSTILRVVPKSHLAVRVSGRWENNEKDRDEEGNLYVNSHKESFKQILAALQINPVNEFPLIIGVNALCRNVIEHTLDYFVIHPVCIRCFFDTDTPILYSVYLKN
jgi:hypothetical protein